MRIEKMTVSVIMGQIPDFTQRISSTVYIIGYLTTAASSRGIRAMPLND